jgi:hypothetical protein
MDAAPIAGQMPRRKTKPDFWVRCCRKSKRIVTMSDQKPALPDRLSTKAESPFFNAACLQHAIIIRFNGKERGDVEEYCISEGWVRVPAGGKTKDRYGNPMLVKLSGVVEPFYAEG